MDSEPNSSSNTETISTHTSDTPPPNLPSTLGELRRSGWQDFPVKEEIRRNLIKSISTQQEKFPRVFGYETSVIPALEHALLACHDIIFLGERGQAKTLLIRSLVNLLDEWTPAIAQCELHDSPYHPVSAFGKAQLEAHGDDTKIAWVHRTDRFAEKLATPDTSIADLIGEVDPIKVAEGRYLSDELTMHYGLVPRAHRGIFAINELPDLAERIQVGLLNVLEERDVQIRGYRIRHHVNQRSGVSVRLSVANYETLAASAVRPALLQGSKLAVPRMCDLEQLTPSTAGKIELETLDEDRDAEVFEHLTKTAVLKVFRETCDPSNCMAVAGAFTEDITFSAGGDIPVESYQQLVEDMPALAQALQGLGYESSDLKNSALVASGVEFILEGLHLSKRLNKDTTSSDKAAIYRGKTRRQPPPVLPGDSDPDDFPPQD